MKLETSEGERAELKAEAELAERNVAPPILEPELLSRLLRDIDTLLAEVERLRAERRPFSDGLAQKVIDEQIKTIDRLLVNLAAAAPPAPPLPAEVEEMRKKLDGPHEWGYRCLAEGPFFISDPAPFDAASLLSRWPGGAA